MLAHRRGRSIATFNREVAAVAGCGSQTADARGRVPDVSGVVAGSGCGDGAGLKLAHLSRPEIIIMIHPTIADSAMVADRTILTIII